MSNKHISQFLDYYCDNKKLSNPQYAVLLKGKWGSGKTHFINNYKKILDRKKQRYIYVSLYGVKNYDEIETKFLQSSNPEIFNEKSIFAGKLANAFINENIKKSLGQIKKSLSSLNAKGNILIFDDLERCSINIVDLLGYINNFVEHQSYKVILIANEEELEKTEKYTQIKEKLVGKTFEFKTDVDLAYDSFLLELKNTNNIKENILEKEKANILELFEKSESKNLRALRQILLDFERFYDEVLIAHSEKENLIKDILYWFFLFSFEIRQGNNEILDLPNLSEEYNKLLFNDEKKDEAKETKYKRLLNKYNLDNNWDVVISFDFWKGILLNSNIEKEKIDLALKNSKYHATEEFNSWKLLYRYFDLDDDTFKILTDEVYFKIYNLEYQIFEEVKMVSSILLALKEKNLIDKTDFCLEYEIKKQIDYLFDKDLIDDEIILHSDLYSFYNDSYENYNYMESEAFSVILEYIKEKIANKLEKKLKDDSNLIISAISENNVNKLYSILVQSNNNFIPYYDKPILKYIDINILVDSLKNSNNETIRRFSHLLEKRYDYAISELISEEEFLIKLKEKLETIKNERIGKLSGYYFDNFSKTLDISIQKVERNKKITE
ncbi:MAG: P-loop NTPase fold protein [Arcobacter sp.]|uniref:P-loop NTPase fold protein n=1 Tax=Arcobacter sp. TaxID=1872629 RepID=UPI003CFD57EC